MNKLNAKQQGAQQAQQQTGFLTLKDFQARGTAQSEQLYRNRKAQIDFLNAWDNEWDKLATAEMPVIRINQ